MDGQNDTIFIVGYLTLQNAHFKLRGENRTYGPFKMLLLFNYFV